MESGDLVNIIGQVADVYNKNISRIKEAFEAETIKCIKAGEPKRKAAAWRNVGLLLSKNEMPLIADLWKISTQHK